MKTSKFFKLIAFSLMVSFLFLALFSACQSKDKDTAGTKGTTASETTKATEKASETAPAKKIQVRLLTRWTGSDANAPALQQLVKEFNEKNSGIEIVDESIADDQSYNNKLKAGVATGSVPNIFQWWAPYEYAKNGILMDLTKVFEEDKEWSGGFLPGSIDSVGALPGLPGRYIIPMETGYEPFYYNTELFKKAGIDKAPETWDEFLEDVVKLKNAGIIPIAAGAKDTWRLGHIFNGIVYKRAGVDKCKGFADGTSKFTDPEFVDSMKILKNLVDIGGFDKNFTGLSYDTEKANFFGEKAAMVYNGTWFVGDCENSAIKDKIKVFFMPVMKDYPQFAGDDILYSYGFGVSNLIKDKAELDATITVAKYISGKEAASVFTQICKRAPVRTDTGLDITKISPLLSEIIEKGKGINKSGMDIQDYYMKGKMSDKVRNSLISLALGSKTPDEIAKDVQAEAERP